MLGILLLIKPCLSMNQKNNKTTAKTENLYYIQVDSVKTEGFINAKLRTYI